MARLKVKQISDFTTAVQSLIDNDADQNAALIAANTASVDSLEAAEDLLIASVDSLENATGAATADLEASVDSLEVVASTAITERGDLEASVDSLEIAEDNAIASIDSLEGVDSELSVEISSEAARAEAAEGFLTASVDSLELAVGGNDTDISDLQASVDSLEIVDGGLADDIADANASIDSLEAVDAALSTEFTANTTYVKQGGLPVSPTSFRVLTPVRFAAGDDLQVFINGLEVHPVGIAALDSTGGDFGGSTVSVAEGYQTADGATFTLTNLGYDLEADDHIHVVAVAQ